MWTTQNSIFNEFALLAMYIDVANPTIDIYTCISRKNKSFIYILHDVQEPLNINHVLFAAGDGRVISVVGKAKATVCPGEQPLEYPRCI